MQLKSSFPCFYDIFTQFSPTLFVTAKSTSASISIYNNFISPFLQTYNNGFQPVLFLGGKVNNMKEYFVL